MIGSHIVDGSPRPTVPRWISPLLGLLLALAAATAATRAQDAGLLWLRARLCALAQLV